ncbi:hypothetical protein [Catellatospora sp. NPDC049609]|uniref:hypothetical protein n=1 Tax=Catellatospora sp. NPDC049609 TaxID=3155505 RepID=UPI003416FAD3
MGDARVPVLLLWTAGPVLGWLLLTRPGPARMAVAVVLAAWGALVGVALWTPVAVEALLAYGPVVVVIAVSGRRLVGAPAAEPTAGRRWIRRGCAAFLVGAVLLGCGVALRAIADEPFVPAAAEVRPLPAGLTVLADTGEDGARSCGSGACSRILTVGGDGDVTARVLAHLRGRGWPDLAAHDCRRVGWLIDRRYLCVQVRGTATEATIVLEGVSSNGLDGPIP